MYKTLEEIYQEIAEIAKQIGAWTGLLPTLRIPRGDATPHLELDERGYHYVVSERGREFKRWTTTDLHELYYWVFQSVTHSMAGKYELHHRHPKNDFRRLLFQKQLELLSLIDPDYAEKRNKEINEILQRNPYRDKS